MAIREKLAKWIYKNQYLGERMIESARYTRAGVSVSPDSAMRLATVNACVRVLSEDVACLPEMLYRRTGEDGRERATDHPLYDIIHRAPNREMTAFTFKQTLMVNVLLTGNAYAFIEFNGRGNPIAMWPLPSGKVEPFRDTDGEVKYRYNGAEVLQAWEVLHIPGMGFDGLKGLSPIRYAADTIGFAAAAEEYGERFFGNGTHLGGMLQTEDELTEEAYKRLQTEFSDMYRGLQRAHGVPILEGGTKFVEMGVSQKDAQFLETRKYQRTEIAALFRVPPHMIGDLEKATFSNIEHQSIEYLQRGLVPWLERIEQEEERKLLREDERKDYYLEHVTSNFLRGDAASRMQAYSVAIMSGIMTPNEARQRENLNPVEGGDEILLPLNMAQGGEPVGETGNRGYTTFREGVELRKALKNKTAEKGTGIGKKELAELTKAFEEWTEKQAKAIIAIIEKVSGKRNKEDELREKIIAALKKYAERQQDEKLTERLMQSIDGCVLKAKAKVGEMAGEEAEKKLSQEWLDGFKERYYTDAQERYNAMIYGAAARIVKGAKDVSNMERQIEAWGHNNSAKLAKNEANRVKNELIVAGLRTNGITSLWIAATAECSVCKAMNGRTITTLLPPLHMGCNCYVVPKKEGAFDRRENKSGVTFGIDRKGQYRQMIAGDELVNEDDEEVLTLKRWKKAEAEVIEEDFGIDDVNRLVEFFGGEREEWRKMKRKGFFENEENDEEIVEIHWYERTYKGVDGKTYIDKVDYKVKRRMH